jgi:hypothetical protein
MIEIEAGHGYNDGAELRLILQADDITTVPQAIEAFTSEQSRIFSAYGDSPSDFRPLMGRHDGYRYSAEYTFPA